MAEIHTGTTLSPSKIELLDAWVGSQRWYAAKGRQPRLRRLTSWRLDDPAGEVGIETLLVVDESEPASPVVYQVPLTYRSAPLSGHEAALVGTMEHGVLGTRWVYDAPHDPVYAERLLTLTQGGATAQAGGVSDTVDATVQGHPAALAGRAVTVTSSRVLSGEQSNTSVILDGADPMGTLIPLICKVFRTLQPGDNPDVVLQEALTAAGSTRVPGLAGSVTGTWPLPDASGDGHGHLAFAQEFLPGTRDAWRVATEMVQDLTDFTARARDLGAATAEVHATLASAMPTEPVTSEAVATIVAGMRGRWESASAEVPALATWVDQVARVHAAAAAAKWPVLQRIHGDYHLGQVLDVPGRGWVLIDFEGEPLRPLVERNEPDLTLRDVAGMLRSFDYAACAADPTHVGAEALAWAEDCQTAFLQGYADVAGRDPREDAALLTAFTLDKALYEVVYEARNRPDWLGIPLVALDRMLDDRRTP